MFCFADAKTCLKTNIAFGRVFIISIQELHGSSKKELNILTELFKNVTCRYLFIMTVTIKMLGEESW